VPPRLLGVFAHPDDEVFCAGGALARYTSQGAEAMVVSVTRGQSGQIRDARAATRRTIGEVREAELRRACTQLGVQHVRCLDYVDGTLAELAPEVLEREVTGLLREFQPHVVITWGSDGGYGHPDHIAIGAATTRACVRFDQPPRLYHSIFRRSDLLLSDRLAHWLSELDVRFRGSLQFAHALSLLAGETATMGFVSDHVVVNWFPPGFYIIEQGEGGSALYLILSGQADVIQEDANGDMHTLRRLGPGEFCGELAIARHQPRSAHVVAVENVTCLVFNTGAPTAFGRRGASARLGGATADRPEDESAPAGFTTCLDVSEFVDRKFAALAEHRTQYTLQPGMLPAGLLQEMFGREYFERVEPPVEPETELLPETASTGSTRGLSLS
jgi:LmbE family N-acetylglucosaminyl deacetylase